MITTLSTEVEGMDASEVFFHLKKCWNKAKALKLSKLAKEKVKKHTKKDSSDNAYELSKRPVITHIPLGPDREDGKLS